MSIHNIYIHFIYGLGNRVFTFEKVSAWSMR